MSNIILVFWFCLSVLFGIMCLRFDEIGRNSMSNLFGAFAVIVFFGLMFVYFIVSEKEKQ